MLRRIGIFHQIGLMIWLALVLGSAFIPPVLVFNMPALFVFWISGMALFGITMAMGLRHDA